METLTVNYIKLYDFFMSRLESGLELYPNHPAGRKNILVVHASLSAFGTIDGGVQTALRALGDACREKSFTLVMPAHTDSTADPAEPVLFDRKNSTCRGMGILAETFRTQKGTLRSAHPHLSFCASGKQARRILRGHLCETGLGPHSPLGTLYREDALVLMLGTGFETCTALHLAEYRNSDDKVTCHAGIVRRWLPGISWKCWEDTAFHPENFPAAGAAFIKMHPEKCLFAPLPGNPARTSRIFRLREIVDFSVDSCIVLE